MLAAPPPFGPSLWEPFLPRSFLLSSLPSFFLRTRPGLRRRFRISLGSTFTFNLGGFSFLGRALLHLIPLQTSFFFSNLFPATWAAFPLSLVLSLIPLGFVLSSFCGEESLFRWFPLLSPPC